MPDSSTASTCPSEGRYQRRDLDETSKDSCPPRVVLSEGTTAEGAEPVDHTDFTAAVDRHYPGLVQRLTLVLHDAEEAKDVAQDAYLRAFQAWDRFDGADARAWLHTIGLRLAFNHLRHRHLWDRWLRSQPRAPSWVMPERVDLWRGIADLRPQQRAALLLNVIDGYTQAEIGRILDAPEGTVASWVAEAKRRLGAALAEEPRP